MLDDPTVQRLTLEHFAHAFSQGSAWRWLLFGKADDTRMLGSVALNRVERGYSHSAHLGYALDAQVQGQGLMREAVETVVAHAFAPGVNLHRLQAACRPENARSLGLLKRLGFRDIGLALGYLCIDGAWRDHRLSERINPNFRDPAQW
jgi:[ribosomal protein S5]-alanine N-acetyltransferase